MSSHHKGRLVNMKLITLLNVEEIKKVLKTDIFSCLLSVSLNGQNLFSLQF